MKFLTGRPGLAFAAAFVTAAALVAPAAADTPISHTGTTGTHSLRDSEATPGINCRYREVDPSPGGYSYEAKLKSIEVTPPRVKASSGMQRVGWRFLVRRAAYARGFGLWITTYTSPIQKRWTNASTNAAFAQMSTSVVVSNGANDDLPHYAYRVWVVMFWYDSDGLTSASSTHEADWMNEILPDFPSAGHTHTDVREGECWAWVGWAG